jgi:uncharacterized protein (DUF433 family)
MIGNGVYPLSDVSRYTGLAQSTLRSWFRVRADQKGHKPLFTSDYPQAGEDYAVSFLNLIDAYVAKFFRTQGVKPGQIRKAYCALGKDLGSPHPFARADLLTDGISIIRKTGEELKSPELIDVVTKNKMFSQWCDHLAKIEYVDELAARLQISRGVVLDPLISFGRPVARLTAVTTFVLANQFHANNEDAALVADLYGVDESDVQNAVRFEAEHSAKRAA